MSDVTDGIRDYLASGGLFNPELMDHQRVRDLVIECRDEIERLRAHIAELEAWQAKGEAIIQPAIQWGPGGNVMVQTSTMFKLGAWWADRPWRVREAMGE